MKIKRNKKLKKVKNKRNKNKKKQKNNINYFSNYFLVYHSFMQQYKKEENLVHLDLIYHMNLTIQIYI